MKKILGLVLGLFLFAGVVQAINYLDYTGYVNDFAKVLSKDFVEKQNLKLKEFDEKTTNQIAVVTVETTSPESIEEYSIHLADKWKPGQNGKDNGIIFLTATKDREMRIEVGRGLEGDLTDLESKQILENVVKLEYKQGNWEAGIDKGVNAIMIQISPEVGEKIATISASEADNIDGSGSAVVVTLILIALIFIIIIVAASPYTPIGGQGTWGITSPYRSTGGGFFSTGNLSSSSTSFGGGSFSGGGASSKF